MGGTLDLGGVMSILYIVAGPKYWASIPKTRELPCGRVRFTNYRCVPPEGADVYDLKSDALKEALVSHRQLIRETRSSEDTWHYQLLLGFTNPLEE